MPAPIQPLFRRRPPNRGYGYDANGVAGWVFTIGFVLMLLATAVPAALLAQGPVWPLSVPIALAALAELAAFIWIAKRESERT